MKKFAALFTALVWTCAALGEQAPILADQTSGKVVRPTASTVFGNADNATAIASGLGFGSSGFPAITGQSGKVLSTDGSLLQWITAGAGTVTSFSAGDLSPLFTTSEATATTTPALSFALSTQAANRIFAGPATGADAAPTFRALVDADIPATLTGKSVNGVTLAGTGTLNIGPAGTLGTAAFTAATAYATAAQGTQADNVGAVNGIVKSNGSATFSAAVAGTDYLAPTGSGASLTNVVNSITGTAGEITASAATGAVTLSLPTSLTSIDNITASSATNMVFTAGSSGASLTLGQGASGAVTLTPTGTGAVKIQRGTTAGGNAPLSIGGTAGYDVTAGGASSGALEINGGTPGSGNFTSGVSFRNAGSGSAGIAGVQGSADNDQIGLSFLVHSSTTGSDSSAEAGRFAHTGNLLIGGTTDITGSGGLKVFGTTAATSTTTGALQVAGGVGVAGAGYFGGILNVAGTGTSAVAGPLLIGATSGTTGTGTIQLAGASAFDLTLLNTGVRTWEVRGGASANDHTTTFSNAGAGKHNVAMSGNLTVSGTGTSSFAGGLNLASNAGAASTVSVGDGNFSTLIATNGVSTGYSAVRWGWDSAVKWHAGMSSGTADAWTLGTSTSLTAWTPYITVTRSNGNTAFASTTASTSSTTGAVVIGNGTTGGLGVGGAINAGGSITSSKAFRGATVAVSGTDIDWSQGNHFTKTLSANTTFTFSNLPPSGMAQTIVVEITNTASNYTVTWPSATWTGGVQPTQTTGAKTDIWTFIHNGTATVTRGSVVQNH
jgi:hypothetical protein